MTFTQVTLSGITRGHPGFLSPRIFLDLCICRERAQVEALVSGWGTHHKLKA